MGAGLVVALQAGEGGGVTANTFDDSQRRAQPRGCSLNLLALVAVGEGTPIQENAQPGTGGQQVFGGGQHKLLAEVILIAGVFDVFRGKERGTKRILVENDSATALRQGPRQRALAAAGQAGHHDEHAASLNWRWCRLTNGTGEIGEDVRSEEHT